MIGKQRLAFSLIELSIVILIIGILIIGISKGSRIISAAKLKTAQALTISSPVNSMDGILLWTETTLSKSFIDSEVVDSPIGGTGTITTWKDINPQTTSPNNATSSYVGAKARYILKGINGLPSLNFNGSDSDLAFNGTEMANTNYTVFVVEMRRSTTTNFFIRGNDTALNQMFNMGYRSDQFIATDQYANNLDFFVPGFTAPIPRIHTVFFNSSIGKNYYINGAPLAATCTTVSCKTGLVSFNGAFFGYAYVGDLGEVIIFKRYLSDKERRAVEQYLSQKWGIKLG